MLDTIFALFTDEYTYVGYLLVLGLSVRLLTDRGKKAEMQGDKKQGGYGKIPVFQPKLSLKAVLGDPKGGLAILKYKMGVGLPGIAKGEIPQPPDFKISADHQAKIQDDIVYCGVMLDKVSRSFAAVIRQLPTTLALPVCVFYLVLRALDTVEDDMELAKFKKAAAAAAGSDKEITDDEARAFKTNCLLNFHLLLRNGEPAANSDFYDAKTIFETLSNADVGEKDERALFKKFDSVVRVFSGCAPAQRDVIADITQQMAYGMAQYIDRDLSDKGTEDLQDYSTYCHYVAGLVGEGLSRLWATASDSGLPEKTIQQLSSERGLKTLSSDMGLFLQKTNIIRDYLEDIVDQRAFWPKEVWGQYVSQLPELKEPNRSSEAIACLNHLICDALEHVPSCLAYLNLLEVGSVQVLRFCAIPQVMAIATLLELYANPLVFKGVVKIPKLTAVRIVVETGTMDGIKGWFRKSVHTMRGKMKGWKADDKMFDANKSDAVYQRTAQLLDEIERLCN